MTVIPMTPAKSPQQSIGMTANLQVSLAAALKAHGAWKQQLIEAVANKNAAMPAAELRMSEISAFGQFLMALPKDVRSTERMAEVSRLHADLHAMAGDVALLVKQGKHEEARAALSTGAFPQISAALNQALVRWQVRDMAA